MFWFKLCPRCSGDLLEDRDQYGYFVTCMQCGFHKDVPADLEGPFAISAEPLAAPVAPQSNGAKRRRISHGGRHFTRTFAFDADLLADKAV